MTYYALRLPGLCVVWTAARDTFSSREEEVNARPSIDLRSTRDCGASTDMLQTDRTTDTWYERHEGKSFLINVFF